MTRPSSSLPTFALTAAVMGAFAYAGAWAALHLDRERGEMAAPAAFDYRFRLPTLDGRQLGPADYPGQVVVVEFWATWCAPCHLQARIFRELHGELAGDGVRFLAVNAGEPEEVVRAFAEEAPFPYPVLLDPEDTVGAALGIVALPTILVFDGAGKRLYGEPGILTPSRARELVAQASS